MLDLRLNVLATGLVREAALIGGEWCPADDGRMLEVADPATNTVLGQVPNMGGGETQRAIAAASAALSGWSARTAGERGRVLRRWHDLMLEREDDLALILSAEQGKPLAEARGEIRYAASFAEWFAEEGKRAYGQVIPGHAADKRLVVVKQPIGVVAAITPWNFPAAMVTRKLAPALAAGCTVVLKPAEATPFTALALAVLAEQAGVPPGVVNVVTGSPVEIGSALTASPVVRKLTFTGSTQVGRLLQRQCADTIKKVSLELGGNAPFLVFDDADVEQAVDGAMQSKFRNCGQTCVSANRFYVQAGIHDRFVARLAERMGQLRVGHGLGEGVTTGPLIDAAAVAKVEAHVEDALAGGAKLVMGGRRMALGATFFEPTLITGVVPDMRLVREETFGPLAGIIRFNTEEEAIALANASEFGLAAYFYTRDNARVWRVAEALEVGMAGINTGLISTEVAPFGGVKQSGIGREGSSFGLDDYMQIKYLCIAV